MALLKASKTSHKGKVKKLTCSCNSLIGHNADETCGNEITAAALLTSAKDVYIVSKNVNIVVTSYIAFTEIQQNL